jgi:hypothetical protein
VEPLIGGAIGAIARLAPEVIKLLDRKNERKHEIAVGNQQLEFIKAQGHMKLESDIVQAESSQIVAGLEAIKEGYRSQKTGFKFADTMSALVRPAVTYMIVVFWALVKIAAYTQLTGSGLPWDTAVQTLWGENDWAMFAGIINFWFLSRVFERRNGKQNK